MVQDSDPEMYEKFLKTAINDKVWHAPYHGDYYELDHIVRSHFHLNHHKVY